MGSSEQERRVSVTENGGRRRSVDNHALTGAAALTTRQSILPVTLVTTLFFCWG